MGGVAVGLLALGAFGPLLSARLITVWRREPLFERLRAPLVWQLAALSAPVLVRGLALVCERMVGESPAGLRLDLRPELFAALVVFSLGEEFGWRGFAYPRLCRRHGPMLASLIVGLMWSLWHAAMWFTPEGSLPDLLTVAASTAQLTLMSVVCAWLFERAGRGMAAALAFHAGGHLSKILGMAEGLGRSQLWVALIAASLAGVALRRARPTREGDAP